MANLSANNCWKIMHTDETVIHFKGSLLDYISTEHEKAGRIIHFTEESLKEGAARLYRILTQANGEVYLVAHKLEHLIRFDNPTYIVCTFTPGDNEIPIEIETSEDFLNQQLRRLPYIKSIEEMHPIPFLKEHLQEPDKSNPWKAKKKQPKGILKYQIVRSMIGSGIITSLATAVIYGVTTAPLLAIPITFLSLTLIHYKSETVQLGQKQQ